jgi:hypothetical protein
VQLRSLLFQANLKGAGTEHFHKGLSDKYEYIFYEGISRLGLSMSIAFWNLGCSTARNSKFENIKNIISYSLQAAWLNEEMIFALETYPYYQFIYLVMRIIHLP